MPKINYEIGYSVDQSSYNSVKQALSELTKITSVDLSMSNKNSSFDKVKSDLENIKTVSKQVEDALEKAFNPKLNSVNIDTFNKSIKDAGLSSQQIYDTFSKAGTKGEVAFAQLGNSVLKTNIQLKTSSKLLDEMAQTLTNTIKWNLASGAVNQLSRTIQQAVGYAKALDGSLNDIRIVTNKGADEMGDFAKKANEVAMNLGKSTTDYTEAALIYHQQGLSDEEVDARTETTLKAASVTGQTGEQVSEQLTAVWNGYKVSAEEAELYVDKLAAVAASTASDLEELSTGMSKVASSAATMGVSEEQLASQLSTIISVTRQAPESVGTALKTIYARMTDIEAGLDEEVSLGEYTGKMAELGINVLDSQNKLRDMGEVIEEVGGKWATFSREQQVALAQTMAGTRQYNNLTALFDNWDQYIKTMDVAANAQGTLQQQQDIYMESAYAHIEQLNASWENLYDSLINSDSIIGVTDSIKVLVDVATNWVDAMGGGIGTLTQLGAIGGVVFKSQLASGMLNIIDNFRIMNQNAQAFEKTLEKTKEFKGIEGLDDLNKDFLNLREQLLNISGSLKPEQFEQIQTSLEDYVNKATDYALKKAEVNALENAYKSLMNTEKELRDVESGGAEAIAFSEKLEELRKSLRTSDNAIIKSKESYLGYNREVLETLRNSEKFEENNEKLEASFRKLNEAFVAVGNQKISLSSLFGEGQMDNLKKLQKEWKDAQNNLLKGNISEEEFDKTLSNVQNRFKSTLNQMKNSLNTLMSEEGVPEGEFDAIYENIDNVETKANEAKDVVENGLGNAFQKIKIENIISAASAIGGLTSTVQSFSSILFDSDLDVGEKIGRSISLLPNAIFYITSLTKALGLESAITAGATAAKSAYTGATSLATAATKGFSAAIAASPLMPFVLAIGAVISVVSLLVGWINSLEKAKEEERKATLENAKSKQKELKAVEDLNRTYETSYQGYKDGTTSKQDMIDATRSLCEELGIEGYETELLAGHYEQLAEKIREAKKAKEEEAASASVAGYNAAEDEFLKNLRGGTKHVTDNGDVSGLGYSFSFDASNEEADKYVENLTQKMQEAGIEAVKAGNQFMIMNMNAKQGLEAFNILNSAQAELASHEDFGLSFESFLDRVKESAPEVNEQLQNLKDNIETLILAEIDPEEEANTQEDFLKKQEEIISKLKEMYQERGISWEDVFGSEEDLEEYAVNLLSQIEGFSEQASVAATRILAEKNLSKTGFDVSQLDDYDEETISVIATMEFSETQTEEAVKKQLEYAQEIADNDKLQLDTHSITSGIDILNKKNGTDNLTKEEAETLKAMEDTLRQMDALQSEYTNGYEEYLSLSEAGSLKQIEFLQNIADIQGENNLQALDGAEQLYEKYNKQINQIKEEMAELEHREKTGVKFSSEDQQRLNDLRDQLNAVTEAKDALDQSFGNRIHVQVEMDAVDEIISMGDQFIDQAQKMQDAAELIGEGFKVAADDADALFDIFPQLADQASILADGTIQLNQGVVQQLLGDQSQILIGDSEAKIAQIDNEIAVLEAKKAGAEAELALANAVAKGNVDISEEEIEKISNGRQQLVQYLMDLGVEESEANAAAAAAMANNMEEYDRIVGQVSDDTANNLAKAIAQAADAVGINTNNMSTNIKDLHNQVANLDKAMASIGTGEVQSSDYVIPGTGGTVVNRNGSTIQVKSFKGTTTKTTQATKPEVQKWIDDLKLDISQYTKGIAQLQALRVKILQTQASAQNAMNNAASGLGGTYKPSTSSSSTKSPTSSAEKEAEQKESDYIDLLEDEWDIYHDIDIQIANIERELQRIQKVQDKLTGKDLIDNLNKQLAVLEKQKKSYEDKIQLARMEANAIKDSLRALGVNFADDGEISNYALAMQQQLEKVNAVIARYNSLSAEQQTEGEKAIVEQAQQDYESFKQMIEAYEELINDTIPDLEDNITEALDREIEIQISKFKMSVDLKLNMGDAERDWNAFKKRIIDGIKDDDILGNAKADFQDILSYYNTAGTGSGTIQALTGQINDTLQQLKEMDNNLDKTSSVYGQNRAQAMEDLKAYMDELMDQLSSVQDLVEQIEDAYLNMIKEAKDGFNEQLEGYEFINDLIDYNKNVIGLLYGEDAYAEMDKYYGRQEENNKKQLDFLRQEAEFWKQKMLAEEEGSEAWKAYKENWEDAIGNLNSTVEDSIQTIIDRYVNLINKVFDDLNNKVSGGLGLDYINDEWDLIKKNADEYLDDINSAFAIDKLRGKFQDAINNTDGIKNQQKLNELMQQQLGDLKTREKLTQYDVDRAEKLLDIEIKRIALQDAQKNKSKMRLKRDASGNYSYQFVSDEESIVQAQQDLADAQNSLYNFDKDAYTNNLNDIYAIYSEFQNKLMELYQDNTLSEEERERKKLLLVEQYQELITAKTEQNSQIRNNLEDSAFQELAKMYGVNVSEFQNMADEQKNILLGDLIPGWNDGIQQMIDKFASEGGLIPVCKDAFKELEEATKDYNNSLTEIENTGGISFDSLAQGYDKNIDLANKLQQENQELINQYDQQIAAIQQVMAEVQKLADTYDVAYKNAVNASKAAYAYWQEQQARDAAEAAKNKPGGVSGGASAGANSSGGNSGTTSGSAGGSGSSNSSGGGSGGDASKTVTDSNIKVGDKLIYTGGLYYYDSQGSGPAGDRGPGGTVTVENIAKGNKYPIAVTSANSAYGWLLPSQLKKLDTGGYTGKWGSPEGRLALLHEKELVLNASDTQNLLKAVDIIRSITDEFDGNVFAMMGGFANNMESITNALANNSNDGGVQNNTFNIEFPNATNQNEIEAAINNLPNIAYQKVMTKK